MRLKAENFSLKYTLEAGQCFGWKVLGNAYYGCIEDTAILIKQKGPFLDFRAWRKTGSDVVEILDDTDEANLARQLISKYLNLEINYKKIIEEISKDNYIIEAVGKYYGIRLVKQAHLECAISFILSGNNNVKRIQKGYHLICQRFGEKIFVEDLNLTLYTFPNFDSLRQGSIKDFEECNAGYRAKYIKEFVEKTSQEELDNLEDISYEEAKIYLTGFLGIGEKIADCILLYSYKNNAIYPTDVWVKRFTNELYLKEAKINEKKIREFGIKYFGEYAGWAQLFLYIFYREKQEFETS